MALGGLTYGVYAREMAAAYQIFGNGGIYNEPYSYEKVEMAGNTILPKRERLTNRALDEDSAYVMNRLLQHVITGRTGATGANGAAGRSSKRIGPVGRFLRKPVLPRKTTMPISWPAPPIT